MLVHLLGVSGTGMGSLAVLLREAGHEVSGSDVAFDPPIGPALEAAGVRCFRGWDPAHLDAGPGLVVGNVIRRDNPEAIAAEARGLPRTSMSRALRDQFLVGRRPLVVAGTHGKTTTAAMCAHVLAKADRAPGWFIGGGRGSGRRGRRSAGRSRVSSLARRRARRSWWRGRVRRRLLEQAPEVPRLRRDRRGRRGHSDERRA